MAQKGFTSESAKRAGKKSTRKGVPNKATSELRKRVNDFLDGNWDKLLNDIDKLEPKDRIETYLKIMEYGLPKLQRTIMEVESQTSQGTWLSVFIGKNNNEKE